MQKNYDYISKILYLYVPDNQMLPSSSLVALDGLLHIDFQSMLLLS